MMWCTPAVFSILALEQEQSSNVTQSSNSSNINDSNNYWHKLTQKQWGGAPGQSVYAKKNMLCTFPFLPTGIIKYLILLDTLCLVLAFFGSLYRASQESLTADIHRRQRYFPPPLERRVLSFSSRVSFSCVLLCAFQSEVLKLLVLPSRGIHRV